MSFDSDHRLVIGDLKAPRVTAPKRGKWKIFKLETPKDEDAKREYQEKISEKYLKEKKITGKQ